MKKALQITFLTTLAFAASKHASAHGSFEFPVSRVYGCYLEGPKTPISAACADAVNIGGTQALYDWMEVNQGQAGGNHQMLIPDGTLCAGGRDKYIGLNQARTDWIESPIIVNNEGNIDFIYLATAPHSTAYFRFYVTKDGYDYSQPLAWGDLDPAFCDIENVTLDNQRYHMSCPSPAGKTGKHIIYNIWQRDDSPEAFYACIDVDFGDGIGNDLIFEHGFEQSTPQ